MDIYDIPTNLIDRARNEQNIPSWFTFFRIYDRWKNYTERTEIDFRFSRIETQMRYYHKDDKCYQIREYVVLDYEVTIRSGTLCYYIALDLQKLETSRIFAIQFLLDSTLNALAEYHDPTSEVASGIVDLGLIKSGASIPPIISDIANGMKIGELLDDITNISKIVEERLQQIARLIALNNTELFCFEEVEWRREWKLVTTFSSIEIIQVECADWILEIPDGETLFVPEHTELIYPLPKLEGNEVKDLNQMRKEYSSAERTTGLKFLKKLENRFNQKSKRKRKR